MLPGFYGVHHLLDIYGSAGQAQMQAQANARRSGDLFGGLIAQMQSQRYMRGYEPQAGREPSERERAEEEFNTWVVNAELWR